MLSGERKKIKNKKVEKKLKIFTRLLNLALAILLYSKINNLFLSISLYILNVITFSNLDNHFMNSFDSEIEETIEDLTKKSIDKPGMSIDVNDLNKIFEKQEEVKERRFETLSTFKITLMSLSYTVFTFITYATTFFIQMTK